MARTTIVREGQPRRPPRPPRPPPPLLQSNTTSSPWRWHLGGPITDFGDEGDAGPSCVTRDEMDPRPARIPRRRRTRVAAAVALLTLSTAVAGPVPTPTPTSPTPTATVTHAARRINTEAEYVPPTTIPTVLHTSVAETQLPYYFTESDGTYYKVDQAWSLYGRAASAEQSHAAANTQRYAVESTLPPGWGNKNDRSAFYNTPLIVAASVILGILIVFGIIVTTYQRRKEQRRRKRHAARMRRKALAAAGLTEANLNDASSVIERDFKARLDELEKAHAAKRRQHNKQHQSTFVRTKVRTWRSGLRRRKTPRSPGGDGGGNELKEQFTPNGGFSGHAAPRSASQRPGSPESLLTRDSASFLTESSRSSQRERAPPAALASEPTTGSDTAAEHASGEHTSGASGASVDADHSGDRGTASSPSASHHVVSEPESHALALVPTGHMPPAYRPASVRSLDVGSSSRPARTTPQVLSQEKARAAGFYPAPATEDAEVAQAVSHRADAKAPIVPPPEDDEARERAAMHIATGDKGEMERLRLGASAPPVMRVDDAGPSAPSFSVDEDGFELVPDDQVGAEASADAEASSPTHLSVPGLPAPPRVAAQRSLRTFGGTSDADGPSSPSAPSAPPLEASSSPSSPSAPSAPPLDFAPSAPPLDDEYDEAAPSAPPLDEGYDGDHGSSDDAEADAETAAGGRGGARGILTINTAYVTPAAGHARLPASATTPTGTPRARTPGATASSAPNPRAPSPHVLPDAEDDTTPPESADEAGDDVRASLNVAGHGFLPKYEP